MCQMPSNRKPLACSPEIAISLDQQFFLSNTVTIVCMCFMALETAMVLCARSQDAVLSLSVRRTHVVFSTAGFTGGGSRAPRQVKSPRYERHPESLAHLVGSNPSHWCTSSRLLRIELPERPPSRDYQNVSSLCYFGFTA